MNTVKDLRQALSEEVKRLQPPAGIESRVLEQALRRAAAVVPAHRTERRGTVRSWESKSIEAPRLMALVAALLAVAIVVGLVFAARTHHQISTVPASHGPVGRGIVTNPVSFTCSLPVAVGLYPSAFVQIQLPDGLIVNESTLPAKWDRRGSYDVQAGKWVPVGQSSISTDGKAYAYDTGIVVSVGVAKRHDPRGRGGHGQ